MAPENDLSRELVLLLTNFRQIIIFDWAREIAGLSPDPLSSSQSFELERASGESLEALIREIASPAGDAADLSGHSGLVRFFASDTAKIVEAFWLCRKAALTYIQRTGGEDKLQLGALLDDTLCRVSARLAGSLAGEARRQAGQARQRTALITDLVRTVGSTLDLFEVLDKAGEAIATAVRANHCFFYLINNELELSTVIPSQMHWPKGFLSPAQRIMKLSPDYLDKNDAAWQVLKDKIPVQIYDAQNDPRTTHVDLLRASALKSFLLVPCLANGNVTAIAVVTLFDEYREFSTDEVELSWAIATIVAPAIENSRLYQKVEQLAGLEERARLAREMHDSLAQNLGAMQLKASQTDDLLGKDQVELARKNLEELNQIAREAYTDVREAIFHLRSHPPAGDAFLPYLEDYLATYQTCFHIQVDLFVEGNPAADLDENTCGQVLYIVQEALTNIRKHADASAIQIRLAAAEQGLQLDIQDNGSGFDLATISEEQAWRHFGLQIMQERAERIGGRLSISSEPGQGTLVRLITPAPDPLVRLSQ